MTAAQPRPAIQVLPPSAAERIAAGEVVERPASVVKELVENSLDAGARRITVEIEGAGQRLIRVTDDGDGIPAGELPLAFERFATSKIRSAADLARVRTYGFRGEALPSIAAVARVTMVTRPRGAEAAARIVVSGGRREAAGPTGGADGTAVTVEHLFFNTPARREFLRSDPRESAVIVETVEGLALAAPDVSFRLVLEGREVLWTPPEPFAARARRILGPQLVEHLLDLEAAGALARMAGVLGTPQVAQPRRARQWFLVNGRVVRSALLSRALAEAFRTLIPEDRHPVAVLSLHVPPEEVDVNVHPRKAEVRFVDERALGGWVTSHIRRALREAHLAHVAPPPGAPEAGSAEASAGPARPYPGPAEDAGTGAAVAEAEGLWIPGPAAAHGWPAIQLIGQLGLTYIVGDAGGDLVLIDQHAAHERILFERLMDLRAAGGVEAQGLVVPVAVELTRAEAALLEKVHPALRALGFEAEPFGPSAVRLTAIPAIAARRSPEELFRACLRDLDDAGAANAGRDLAERLAIATACHTALRAGDRLDPSTMRALLDDLARARDPFSCFHGRPTMVRIRSRDVERWFYRRM